jgi:hypothetical protein
VENALQNPVNVFLKSVYGKILANHDLSFDHNPSTFIEYILNIFTEYILIIFGIK